VIGSGFTPPEAVKYAKDYAQAKADGFTLSPASFAILSMF